MSRNLAIFGGLVLGSGLLIIQPDLNLADRLWCLGMMASCFFLGWGTRPAAIQHF